MGYTTDFSGQVKITPELKPEHEAYLRAFANTRRMQRNAEKTKSLPDPVREAAGLPVGVEGGYYVGSPSNHGQDATPDVVDHNEPPAGQPGLWCQWTVEDGALVWDGGEKFYEYVEWLEYLVHHFFQPWGYSLTGQITWQGEDPEDIGCIDVRDNVIRAHEGRVVYPGLEPARAACGCVGSEPGQPCPKCAMDEAGMAAPAAPAVFLAEAKQAIRDGLLLAAQEPAPAKTIDLTPTAPGFARMVQMFETEAKQARENAVAAEDLAADIESIREEEDTQYDGPDRHSMVHAAATKDLNLIVRALEGWASAELERAGVMDKAAEEARRGQVSLETGERLAVNQFVRRS